jgi:hypothetical protein
LFQDFPEDALRWIIPEALQTFGKILHIEFLRQEPKKRKLADRHLILDLPILFTFENRKVILWLMEFQEDRRKFSIYKLLKYVADKGEEYPDALLIPTVVFTDRRKWKKDADRKLNYSLGERQFLHFEYVFVKLFDLNARDYFQSSNPVVRILLSKMNYRPEEKREVYRKSLTGLFRLTSAVLFDKYSDFIDIYSDISEEEREDIYREFAEEKEAVMMMQYIREKERMEGRILTFHDTILESIGLRFGSVSPCVKEKITKINNIELLKLLHRQSILADSVDKFLQFADEKSGIS